MAQLANLHHNQIHSLTLQVETFGTTGYWWSSTEYDTSVALMRYLFYNYNEIEGNTNWYKKSGLSVRMIKN
jgi:uncharacterized protein (TIGR02145 family)